MSGDYAGHRRKVGIFLIRALCVLFIVSGIAGFIIVCNGGSIAKPDSPHDHCYSKTGQAESTEGALYSLGVMCMGGVGLLLAKGKNSTKDKGETST